MAKAQTQKFEELIVEVEFDPVGAAGTYTTICGIVGATVTRTANIDSEEIPDCDDESLPLRVEKQVRSLEVSASGQGVWARQSHKNMMDWFYSAASLDVRIRNKNVEDNGATGDPYVESGPALLANLNNTREKGRRVTAEIDIQFDSTPARTNVA